MLRWSLLRAVRVLAIGLAACWCTAAFSVQTVSGQGGGVLPSGDVFVFTFTCTGSPTCTGTYTGGEVLPECANEIAIGGGVTVTGLDLSAVQGLQGQVTLQGVDHSVSPDANHQCTIQGGARDKTLSYQGGWDGTEGGLLVSGVDDDGSPFQFGIAFTATGVPPPPAKTPPFQMTTSISVTPTTTSATAQITYPAGDVGTTASVFVFALAPRSVVKRLRTGAPLDGPDSGCVLAQLDPSGHLVQTSAAQLQPYVTGVLQASGQAVTVLDNAANAQVAGASFFVGYGSDGASMVASGVNRNVTTIPGGTTCPAVVPANAGPLSGLWWNPNESGWGIDFVQRRNHVFAAWFTYDASGSPKWYVASDCAMQNDMASAGRCTGQLFEVAGAPFFGVPFDASRVHAAPVGTLQVDFTDANDATMTYTVNGVSRTVAIVRQLFAGGTTAPAIDYTDLWWSSPANSESGWGMAISHQFHVMFLAWFVYDASGKPIWYVASDCEVTGNACSGDLFTVSGPPFGPTFDASQVHATKVGTVTATFSGPNDGTLSYTVGTTTASKAITRQIF